MSRGAGRTSLFIGEKEQGEEMFIRVQAWINSVFSKSAYDPPRLALPLLSAHDLPVTNDRRRLPGERAGCITLRTPLFSRPDLLNLCHHHLLASIPSHPPQDHSPSFYQPGWSMKPLLGPADRLHRRRLCYRVVASLPGACLYDRLELRDGEQSIASVWSESSPARLLVPGLLGRGAASVSVFMASRVA